MNSHVGILGIGVSLPDEIRTNDWWPDRTIQKWRESAVDSRSRIDAALEDASTDGQRLVLEAMKSVLSDPFRGVVERRVLSADVPSSAVELDAARSAISDAKINPAEIDVLLAYSMVPDDITVPNAVILHDQLRLPDTCFTTSIEGTCNSFLLQLALAEQMVASGRARYALLVQSCCISKVMQPDDPQSVWFGDGATAVVIGKVDGDAGILGQHHITDSSLRNAVMTGVPGKHWYDEGRSVFYARDRSAAYQILLGFADYGKRVIDGACLDARVIQSDVGFFACHQAQLWQRDVAQRHSGLTNARSIDTFKWAGNIGASNLPLVLHAGRKEGLLRRGDVVALYGGGAGVTVSGVVLRWGVD